jgi:glucitol operon activator protein
MSTSMAIFLALLVLAWFLQGALSFWQARRFYGRIQQLRSYGRTAVGMSGSLYRGRAYGVLAVDDKDRIVRAEQLSGFTIFAQLRPAEELVGRTLSELLSEPVEGLSAKVYGAFKMAAETLADESEPADEASGEAEGAGSIEPKLEGLSNSAPGA